MNRIQTTLQAGKTGHEYMPGRGASGGLAGALNSEDQIKPKTGSDTPLREGRFRLIVDAWATFHPGTCTPPRRDLDDVVSPSTIRLKRASTIAEIRIRALDGSTG